jgi:acetoin utilization deacetylase AcuC-like enzyme
MLKIAFSPVYKYELPENHRFPMVKYELLPEQLLYEGTVTDRNFFMPEALSDELIELTHSKSYLYKLNNQLLSLKEIRNIGFPMSDLLVQRGKHIANGTYKAAEYAIHSGIGMNIAGGTHHSFSDHGEGFCLFNDIAIAANILLHKQLVNKILIVDLDVHQGNGTAKIFSNNPKVFTFSMHGEKNYPTRKEFSDLDLGMPDKCDDSYYLNYLKEVLSRLIDVVQPDFIFYLAGVDILESDKLGRLSISKQGCKERDKCVLQMAKDNMIPIAVTMGGGYSPKISDIIDAHANTFRLAQEIYF